MYSLVRQILLYLIFHGDWKRVRKSNRWEFSHSFLTAFQWRNDMLEDVRSGGLHSWCIPAVLRSGRPVRFLCADWYSRSYPLFASLTLILSLFATFWAVATYVFRTVLFLVRDNNRRSLLVKIQNKLRIL